MFKLTQTRRALLAQILELGSQAVIGNVARNLGITKQAVAHQVKLLRETGYIQPSAGRYAPLELTEQGRSSMRAGLRIYGEIAAGLPIHAEQVEASEQVASLEQLLGMQDDDYLLKVTGESMVNIGVMPGDFVIIRPCADVEPGQVAVCFLVGENTATLKRVFRKGKKIYLRSENDAAPEQVYAADEVQIQGRMIGKVGIGVSRRSTGH